MLNKHIRGLLEKREFVSIATCDFSGRPNIAPKFILKTDADSVYLVDYVFGRTWENLKVNPKASLSIMDTETLIGYQMNGSVELIDKGPAHDKIVNELIAKEVSLSTERIIQAVSKGKANTGFEVGFSNKVVIFKVKIEEIAEIAPHGSLKREKL